MYEGINDVSDFSSLGHDILIRKMKLQYMVRNVFLRLWNSTIVWPELPPSEAGTENPDSTLPIPRLENNKSFIGLHWQASPSLGVPVLLSEIGRALWILEGLPSERVMPLFLVIGGERQLLKADGAWQFFGQIGIRVGMPGWLFGSLCSSRITYPSPPHHSNLK